MKILITGGNGFLGSNLVEYILNKKNDILVISKNSNNIKHLLNRIEFIEYDSINYFNYENKILKFSPDIIIHCAWDGGGKYEDVNDTNQIYKNLSTSLSLLEIINKQTTKPLFIGFGSVVEYGFLKEKAYEDQIENPVNFYGLSKNTFKKISELYCQQNNIDWLWIRPCYVYGPKDIPSRLIPNIISKLLKNEQLILNSCDTIIDYMYIDDFCEALYKLIITKSLGVYNVCSGEEYSIKSVIHEIHNIMGLENNIIFNPSLDRKFSSKYNGCSNTKLLNSTKMTNLTSLNEGLKQTIHWIKNNK